jgi:hypothetical protein
VWEAKAAVCFQPAALCSTPRNAMVQNTIPSRQHYAAHYPAVRERAGLTDSHDLAPEFETRIREIFNGYWAERKRPTIAAIQEALELYIKGRAVACEAMQALDPIRSEIALATQLADLSTEDREEKIEGYLEFRAETDHLSTGELERYGELVPEPNLDALILEQDRGIGFLKDNPDVLARLLKRQTGDYRKNSETALVVEPTLDLLDRIGFTPTKKLTRKAFFEALFCLLGIEPELRPTPARISVIVDNRKKKSRPVAT